ncbi:mandelate racemase/muconate lactonizing enzyme family protein [Flavitalea sp.]|nr:dipeptide epimerase [Flavitalea sp.]
MSGLVDLYDLNYTFAAMKITHTDIYKFSIPMHPFTIATGTMHYAQNLFIRVHTEAGGYGVGECSAFPMIVGETQATCFEMAKDFAAIWKNKSAGDIEERMHELHLAAAFNGTVKSAFDMALYDLAARWENKPLYEYLGGKNQKKLETDITVGIGSPDLMAQQAAAFVGDGFRIIKVKLGKDPDEDIERIHAIRKAVPPAIVLRLDANQGWSFEAAVKVLQALGSYNVAFCEQPMRAYDDHYLPQLRKLSTIPIMADESVFTHHDAKRLIRENACDFVNIKLAKSGGILEALKINRICEENNIPCMMGGMLESRVALSAFAHFALACDNIIFNDMDTCMLGHKLDPVTGGVYYNGYYVELPAGPGIGADADNEFLKTLEKITI